MTALSKALDKVYLGAAWFSGGLLILMACLVLFSVLARIIGIYSGGSTDVAGYVMATCTFMALSYTFRSHGHIRVSLLISRTSGATHRFLTVFCLGVMSLLITYFAFYMGRLAYDSWKWGEKSQGADAILLWIPQVPVAVGATLFAISVIHTFVEVLITPDAFEEDGEEGPNEI